MLRFFQGACHKCVPVVSSIPKCDESGVSSCLEHHSSVNVLQKGLKDGHNFADGLKSMVLLWALIPHLLWMLHVPISSKATLKELKVKLLKS